MNSPYPIQLYLRILLVSVFVALIGLSPAPRSIETLLVKAYQSASVGDMQNASKYLIQVADYYPQRRELIVQAGRYAFQAGDSKAAIQYLDQPGIIDHLSTSDLINLGDAYSQAGDYSRAEAIWKQVNQQGGSKQVLQRLINLYLRQNDYASAVSYMQEQLALDPADVTLYYQIGVMYAATDPLKALPFLATAAEIDPANASAALSLHDKIQTASLFDQPAYTLLACGRELANTNEWEYAAEAFKRSTELDPGYADAWAFLGEAVQQTVKKESGVSSGAGFPELEHALQLDPGSVLANTFMGLYWERQQDYSQAQYYLEQAIAANSADPYLYSELGNILSKAGDLPAAQSAYETAIKSAPNDPLFYRLLAQFALENQIQIRELALPAARQAIMINPNDSASLDVMAQVMLMLKDYRSAERYSLDALHADPDNAMAYLHLGMSYLYLGEGDLALKWLGVAQRIDPSSWVADLASRMIAYYFP